MVDRKVVASGLFEALELADRELRERMRPEFRKVDRIKSRPGWTPFATFERKSGPCPTCGANDWKIDKRGWRDCRVCRRARTARRRAR